MRLIPLFVTVFIVTPVLGAGLPASATPLEDLLSPPTSLVVNLNGNWVTLHLRPNPLIAPAAFLEEVRPEGTVAISRPETFVWRGHVAGELDSMVRLVTGGGWLSGVVHFSQGWFFLEPEGTVTTVAQHPLHTPWLHTLPASATPAATCAPLPAELQPPSEYCAQPEAGTTFTGTVVVDADHTLYERWGNDWSRYQLTLVNNADGIWESQVNIKFRVVGQHVWTTNDGLTAPNCSEFHNQAAMYWSGRPELMDIVLALAGKDIKGCRGLGDVLGRAFLSFSVSTAQVGAPDEPDDVTNGSPYSGGLAASTRAVAHEIGHNYGQLHDVVLPCQSYANCWLFSPWFGEEWNSMEISYYYRALVVATGYPLNCVHTSHLF